MEALSSQIEAAARTSALDRSSRPRAVVYGGGIGIFPSLMQRFREDFQVVALLQPELRKTYEIWSRLRSVRPSRTGWYRAWRYRLEKTPEAFRMRTRESMRLLGRLDDRYDIILFGGATFAPSTSIDKPLFVFADFCRRLSSLNPHDQSSHFRSAQHESWWLEHEGRVYRSAARVFVGSEFVKRALVEHYQVAPERVVVSGFGAGMGFGEAYGKSFDGRTILYIGKGDFEKKGGTLLMQAFQLVRQEIPDAVLHVVGQDRLPTAPGVVNEGFVRDRQRLVALMRTAHVFALPSLVDRNPISVLEAMAAATPCVTSDYAAIPEILGNAGIAVPSGDVAALAKALVTVLRDRALAAQLGAAGRARFEQRYNWDRVWEIIRREMTAALQS
jgi:glycosyltransferase involved in cell wall biosynthesis